MAIQSMASTTLEPFNKTIHNISSNICTCSSVTQMCNFHLSLTQTMIHETATIVPQLITHISASWSISGERLTTQ